MSDIGPGGCLGRMGIPDPSFLPPPHPILVQIHMTRCQTGCPTKEQEAVGIRPMENQPPKESGAYISTSINITLPR